MSLLLNESPLIILPSLARRIGLNEAIIIQQIHYWILKPGAAEVDGKKWVWNSIVDWQKQFPFWSQNTIRNTMDKLVSCGILIKDNHNKVAFDRTSWYTIDYDKLCTTQYLDTPYTKIEQMDLPNVGEPIPKTTTETTTENKEKDIKENEIFLETCKAIVEHLNISTGQKWRHTTKDTQKWIRARLNDKFVFGDFIKCIDNMAREWLDNEDMCQYLRPSTLFGPKMEGYVNKKSSTEMYCDAENAKADRAAQEEQPEFFND